MPVLPFYQQRNYYNNMADNRTKLQLRPVLSISGDRTPSPPTKLLINHGKPNFTIQRSCKMTQNGNVSSSSPTPTVTSRVQNNNNDFVVKSTTFNGVFKPSNLSAVAKQKLPQNGNASITTNDEENEATKVVLRRPKFVPTEMREPKDDENVPEFILRQRRIQERLANQNILDFENRRSGYFTQVLISPSSPNRQSFAETMASPAVKPGLEMPTAGPQHEDIKEETTPSNEYEYEHEHEHELTKTENKKETVLAAESITLIEQAEEEEVAKAIEEVNKAVEGEDDDRTDLEETEQSIESTIVAVANVEHADETKPEKLEKPQEIEALEEHCNEESAPVVVTYNAAELTKQTSQQNGHFEAEVTSAALTEERIERRDDSNVLVEEQHLENGHSNGITISHTNDLNSPILHTPDPKGEKIVYFEPKTVVSFSQELGNGDNKYPDIVTIVRDAQPVEVDTELKELANLKFEIKANDQDIEVKQILTSEST